MSSYTATKYQSVSIFSPDGRVNALKNIQQATMLGNTAVMGVSKQYGMIIAWRGPTGTAGATSTDTVADVLAELPRKIFVSQSGDSSFLFTFSGITNDGNLLHQQIQQQKLMENIWKNRQTGLRLEQWKKDCGWRCILNGDRAWGVSGLYIGWSMEKGTEKVSREWLSTGSNPSSGVTSGSNAGPSAHTEMSAGDHKITYSHKYGQETVQETVQNINKNINQKISPTLVGYELCPTGSIRNVYFTAIGSRAQSCKTILELNNDQLNSSEQMKILLVRALRNAHGEGIGEQRFMECLEGWCIDKNGVGQIMEF